MTARDANTPILKVSVILPTYCDWDNVALCLEMLAAQDLPASDFEVIVANNNRDPDVPTDLPLGPNMRVVWAPTPGSYAARNTGLAASRGAFVFFIDADCRPIACWLSQGLRRFETVPGCRRIAGPVLVTPDTGVWNGWSLYDSAFNLCQEAYVRRGYAVTANLAVEKTLFEEIGTFREESFSGEDKEWNRRASAAGVPLVYQDGMSVAHPARDSFADCAQKRRRLAGARFVAKSGRPVAQRMPRLHYILPSPAAFWKIWRHPVPVALSARLAAMWCHYALGWVHNAEIIRLGLFGGTPER